MAGKLWTEEEVNFLKDNYPLEGSLFCANALGRTDRSVKVKVCRLGLKSDKYYWTKEEEEFIVNNQRKGWEWCAKHLNKSSAAIQNKAAKLGIKSGFWNFWSEEELEHIRQYYPKGKILDIVDALGRSYQAIVNKASDLGVRREILIESTMVTYLYVLYLPSVDLYKIGITGRPNNRFSCLGVPYEVLSLIKGNFIEAIKLEKELLNYIKPFKVNSGLLRSGNTETYKCY